MSLDVLRKEIDDIDYQIAELFDKRMKLVKKVIAYKIENDISVLDVEREEKMIERNKNYVSLEFREYYLEYLKCLLKISKEYQEDNYE